jgi:hypothetical protein
VLDPRKIKSKAKEGTPKSSVMSLLEAMKFPEDKYKIGLTKIFLRAGQVGHLFPIFCFSEEIHFLLIACKIGRLEKYQTEFVGRNHSKILPQTLSQTEVHPFGEMRYHDSKLYVSFPFPIPNIA